MTSSYVNCFYCQFQFLKENRHINENLKLSNKIYCSSSCQYLAKSKQIQLSCEGPGCTEKFYRVPSGISDNNFCSHTCAARFTNHIRAQRTPKKLCLNCNKIIPKKQSYCSNMCWSKYNQLSHAQLISSIKITAKKLGRPPTKRECQQASSCVKHFGSWNNALVRAGLSPYTSLNQKMYKRRFCIASDGHKCNSVSELIIDNWLCNHNIMHIKEVPYPTSKSIADWLIDKNVFVEYFGLANDSIKYDIGINKKRLICQQNGINLIEVYSKNLFPKNNLSTIFKNFLF